LPSKHSTSVIWNCFCFVNHTGNHISLCAREEILLLKFATVCLEHFRLRRPLPILDFQFLPQLAVVVAVSLQRSVDGIELRIA